MVTGHALGEVCLGGFILGEAVSWRCYALGGHALGARQGSAAVWVACAGGLLVQSLTLPFSSCGALCGHITHLENGVGLVPPPRVVLYYK